MASCKKCGKVAKEIAEVLSLCAGCIRQADASCLAAIEEIHARSRSEFSLPARPPAGPEGIKCGLCVNQCCIPAGARGYCGVHKNEDGRLKGGGPEGAVVSWYHDPLPTNCVADWVCAGGTGAGYPAWAYRSGPERSHVNLAVFYEACTFDCLFCQNWHYRQRSLSDQTRSAPELADAVTAQTSCICFFGGDPTPQLPHALDASKLARQQNDPRILRICWETNGSMAPGLLDEMINLSLDSGGCLKFDLKAMDPNLHLALCGVHNRRTLQNFAAAARRIPERPEPPPLVASTLLVPGY
ncbi:MAG: pyruvate formate lyase-activating protein, partial [Phycisphaerae bacterium SM23_30]